MRIFLLLFLQALAFASNPSSYDESLQSHYERQLKNKNININELWASSIEQYFVKNLNAQTIKKCQTETTHILAAYYKFFYRLRKSLIAGHIGKDEWVYVYPRELKNVGSALAHFFLGAYWEGQGKGLGQFMQMGWEFSQVFTKIGFYNFLKDGYPLDKYVDDAYGFLGANFTKLILDKGEEKACRCKLRLFADKKIVFADFFMPLPALYHFQEVLDKDPTYKFKKKELLKHRDSWVKEHRARIKDSFKGCF